MRLYAKIGAKLRKKNEIYKDLPFFLASRPVFAKDSMYIPSVRYFFFDTALKNLHISKKCSNFAGSFITFVASAAYVLIRMCNLWTLF